ncbi:hypothetical protein SLS58_002802 [Diplodia intermedia]|uniref:N-acetyltransferase domain-containing protein n=1 Tax=Diplodia intermedia TaxID=856260 RepID=A0ABR3TYK4_9PEZI
MTLKSKVQLIPWDPESPDHVQRLVEQRLQCGWHAVRVASKWRDEQRAGSKCLYWIQKNAIKDTASSFWGVPRSPSTAEIHPIGHISIDRGNKEAEPLNLDLPDSGVYWIKTFYISNVLQNNGVGRAAMDMIETMATEAPLYARALALDTLFAGKGPQPRKMSNHEWYARRGYREIKVVQNYYQDPDPEGKIWDSETVFMRRDIS